MLANPQGRRFRRRALSMTSLIDVIFLLLLFFMLTSTFSKYAEVELLSAGSGQVSASDLSPVFMRLSQDHVSINGTSYVLDNLTATLAQPDGETGSQTVLVSVADTVTSQRLVDLLAVLGQIQDISVQVLGSK